MHPSLLRSCFTVGLFREEICQRQSILQREFVCVCVITLGDKLYIEKQEGNSRREGEKEEG